MKKIMFLLLFGGAVLVSNGCAYIGASTNLGQVAQSNGLVNVTTGDGTFENYNAVGQYKATEIGIALGIFTFKYMELYPVQSNEELLGQIAQDARNAGSDAMINVTPHREQFYGFIIGLYIDTAEGTGIKLK